MKKIFALLLSLMLFISVLTVPVYAAEQNQTTILPKGQTINSDYFGTGNEVRVSGTVNGDAYVAGGTVIVDGTVNGDLLTAGGNVTITGTIRNNIRAAGGNITISDATVGGNITALGGQVNIDSATKLQGGIVTAGGNIQIFAPVPRGITVGGGNVVLGSFVGRDVNAGVGTLSITQNAELHGNLTYISDQKANIAEGASVSGKVRQEIPQTNQKTAKEIGKTTAAAALGVITVFKIVDALLILILGLLFIWLFPIYTSRVSIFVKTDFGWALLIGLGAIVLTPIAGIILLVTLVGIPLAVTLFFVYILVLWIARIFVIYAIGDLILKNTKTKTNAVWTYVLGIAIYFILTLIPIVSFITHILVTLAGVGAFVALKQKYYIELRAKKLI